MGKRLVLGSVVTILCLPCGVARAEDERGKVDLRTQSVTVSEDMFVEKIPVGRGVQIVEETVKGGAQGMRDGAAGAVATGIAATVVTGGTAAPLSATGVATSAVGGGMLGAVKGAYQGATEPTEYNEFDKREINQGLQDRGTDTSYRR